MTTPEHDDGHGHDLTREHSELSALELRVRALETVLTQKGYVDPKALDVLIDTYQTKFGTRNGAQVVARAWVSLATLLLGAVWLLNARSATGADVRLYTLDCGHATFKDMGQFSDTGEYDGKQVEIAVPCFVIRRSKGVLLWDTGLGDKFAANKNGTDMGATVHLSVPVTLLAQLKSLGLAPQNVTYVAFSHLHWDHSGNANEFPDSTWIINRRELAAALATPPPDGIDPATFSAYKTAKTQLIDGDHDVFGDGTGRILAAPGHTAGHQVLEVKLPKSGVVILSGDLYHLRANREFMRVPAGNASRAETLASMNRIETIVKNTQARCIVQHDPLDFQALPKFPAYLE